MYYFHSSALVGWTGSQLWSGLPSPPVSGMSPCGRIFNSVEIVFFLQRDNTVSQAHFGVGGKFPKGWEFVGK